MPVADVRGRTGLVSKLSRSRLTVWRMAVTRPTVASYGILMRQALGSTGEAWAWLFGVGLLTGVVASTRPLFWDSSHPVDAGLVLALAAFAALAAFVWALFAGCTHAAARMLGGSGAYGTLVSLSATFTVPLMFLLSLLSLVPAPAPLPFGASIYWLALYVVATQTVYGLPRGRALVSVLIALLVTSVLSGGAVLGFALSTLAMAV